MRNEPMDDEPEIVRRIEKARQRRGQTYHGYASGDLDDLAGGRFRILKKPSITGSAPVAEYPRLPEGSPWAKDEFAPEPPIDRSEDGVRVGYRIDAREDVAGDPTVDRQTKAGVARPKWWRRF